MEVEVDDVTTGVLGVEVALIYLGSALYGKLVFSPQSPRWDHLSLYLPIVPKGGQTLTHSCASLKRYCLFSVYMIHYYTYICLFHYRAMLCTLDFVCTMLHLCQSMLGR